MIFRAAAFEFTFPRPILVMGIVNVTPDSFSDGGRYFDSSAAIRHGLELVSEGADIIDVGGESTRPNAKPVSEKEELRRVLPVIEQLASQVKVPISVDTRKPIVARAALGAGASMVNDVAANRNDNEMWQVVAQAGAGYVAMHMQGTPETMQINPVYQDVVREVEEFFADRLRRLEQAGVRAEQLVLDVGFGFGKTLENNLALLAALKRFTRFQRPLLLGVSRKSFIGKLLGLEMEERLPAALACSCWAVHSGAHVVRTHDVAATVTALRMTEAILARSKA